MSHPKTLPQKKMQNKRPMIRYRKKEDRRMKMVVKKRVKTRRSLRQLLDQRLLKLTMLIPAAPD